MPISHKTNFLIVEDDEPKLNAVVATLREIDDASEILVAGSVASAIKTIDNNVIDLAIIDMSLPTFDILNDINGGGRPQGFGGRDILRFLESEQPNAAAVVLTQYEEFNVNVSYGNSQNLQSISTELTEEFGSLLLEVIYYSGRRGEWRDRLKSIINSLHKDME
jgi:CheY-like chemotaxis protein